jgi:hypothetical protein
MQQPKNALRYRCAAFLVLRSGLFYLPFLTPPTPPTTTPENIFFRIMLYIPFFL